MNEDSANVFRDSCGSKVKGVSDTWHACILESRINNFNIICKRVLQWSAEGESEANRDYSVTAATYDQLH